MQTIMPIVVSCDVNAIAEQWRIQGVGAVGPPSPYWLRTFIQKAAFFRAKGYRSLCAFAINDDGADNGNSANNCLFSRTSSAA